MAQVWIPSLMRDLTGGDEQVEIPAHSVREVVNLLEQRYPGIKERLMDGERIRPGIAVVVDGQVSSKRERHKLGDSSEVHFLPAISGGSLSTRK